MSDIDPPAASGLSEYVTVQVAAGRCNVAERTVRRWVVSGRVRTRQGRRGILVAAEDLAALAAESGQPGVNGQAESDSPDSMPGMSAADRTRPDLAVIGDALRLVEKLQEENRNLAGQVGYYQAQVEQLREQLALEAPKPGPVTVEPTPEPEAAPEAAVRRWWKFWR